MNSYIAIRTAGITSSNDFTWKLLPQVDSVLHKSFENICDQTQSFAVVCRSELFDVFLGGTETGLVDYRKRDVFAAIAFCGLTEAVARNLIVFAIDHAEEFAQLLLAAICREPADQWSIDTISAEKILKIVNQREIFVPNLPPFVDAWERFYTTCTADKKSTADELSRAKDELLKLSEELKRHSFSDGNGLKLLVSYAPPQEGYNRALAEADRFLWKEGHGVDLSPQRKKKVGNEPTRSGRSNEPSKTPSLGGNCPSRFAPSKDGCWLNPNKGLLIVCGVLTMIAVVAISSVLIGTGKKKVPERELVMPATKAIPSTDGTLYPKGRDSTPVSDGDVVPASSDEKIMVDADQLNESPEKEESTKP